MQTIQQPVKTPLPYEELRDVIDLSLWTGQLLLQYGAETSRIEETVHHIGTGLGCDWMDVIVSPDGLLITTTSGDEFRTKARRVVRLAVNFSVIDQVNNLSHRVDHAQIDRHILRAELKRISEEPPLYSRWLIIGLVGLACAAFSRLFGADLPVMAVTFCAAACAMFIRQELSKHHLNHFIVVVITAFIAGSIAGLAVRYNVGTRPDLGLAAAVLLLVPGVPLITSVEDILHGSILMGIARGVFGLVVSLGIAIGLTAAIRLIGVSL